MANVQNCRSRLKSPTPLTATPYILANGQAPAPDKRSTDGMHVLGQENTDDARQPQDAIPLPANGGAVLVAEYTKLSFVCTPHPTRRLGHAGLSPD